MLSLMIWNVRIAVTCECGRVVQSRKSVYFGIRKLYCTVHIIFMYHVLHVPCFAFFVIDRTWKQTLLIKRFDFAFIKDRPSVSQSYVQAVTAENEKQYTCSNITYKIAKLLNKFQNCCLLSLRITLKEVLLKCRQIS